MQNNKFCTHEMYTHFMGLSSPSPGFHLLEFKAEKILTKYQVQDCSYTDAVSFAAMRALKIGQAFPKAYIDDQVCQSLQHLV